MLFGVAAIELFYFGWSCLIYPRWGVTLPGNWLRCHLLALAAMMLSLQAIVWSFHRFPWIRFVLLSTIVIGLGAFGILMPVHDFPGLGQSGTLLCLASIMVIAYGGAILGVQRDRHGGWQGWTSQWLERVLDALPRRHKNFRSQLQAQLWFEWRRKGLFVICLVALPPAATVMTFPVPSALYFETTQALLTYAALPIMVTVMSSIFGLGLAKSDFWRREPALHPFIATRPVSTGDLVMAKMKAAALIVLCGFFLFLLLAVPAFNLPRWLTGEDAHFPSWTRFKTENATLLQWASHPIVILTSLALSWQAMIDGMCIGLTGNPRSILWQSMGGGAIFSLLLFALMWFVRHPVHFTNALPVLPWLGAALLLFKAMKTIGLMRMTRVRQLYSKRQLGWLTLIWVGIGGCVAGSAFLLRLLNLPKELLLFGVAWLFPGASLARCALNLADNRHR
jgi:hypothetical protein